MNMDAPEFSNLNNQYEYYFGAMNKAIATSTTSGYFNAIYGAHATINLNTEVDAWAAMSKRPYRKSGFRLITALPQYTDGSEIGRYGQMGESDSIPDELSPTVVQIEYRPKIHIKALGNTLVQQWLATTSTDDTYGDMNALKLAIGTQFNRDLNSAICRPVEDALHSTNNYTAANIDADAIEPLDRLISSKAERDAIAGTKTGYYTPWLNSNVNRDTSTTFDCTVVSAGGGTLDAANGEVGRPMLSKFINDIAEAGGGRPTMMLTNWKVNSALQQLFEDQNVQNLTESNVSFSVNGVDTQQGMQAGVEVSSLYKVPLIISQHVRGANSDSAEIGRIYALNQRSHDMVGGESQIGLAMAIPTIYGELGMAQGMMGMLALDRVGSKGAYLTMAQMVMGKSVTQGKIRDIGDYSVS